jgi:hypothetical protein
MQPQLTTNAKFSFYQSSEKTDHWRENGFGKEWAEQAAKLLFREAEVPEEEKVVAFTILCLYWYGQGDWQRSIMHEGNALIHLRLACSPRFFEGPKQSLQTELSCRRFWAAYIINQFVSEPATSFSWTKISKLKLPCEENYFESGTIPSTKITLQDQVRTPTLYAEVVRVTALW